MRFPFLFVLTVFLLARASLYCQTVAINEIMASNSQSIADEDGEFNDWIEVFNYGNEPVELEGFGISDNPSNPYKWVFPNVSLWPGDFILIWASGKNRSEPGMPLHSNFSISSSGEPILITNPDGIELDHVPATSIPSDISYGRQPDGHGAFGFFYQPTPGESNIYPSFSSLIEPPEFLMPGGIYDGPLSLTISHENPNAVIYYTLDGSEPKASNTQGVSYLYKNSYPGGALLTNSFTSQTYTEPLYIEDRSGEANKVSAIVTTNEAEPTYLPDEPVQKATVLKARAYIDGQAGPIRSSTYFVSEVGTFDSEIPLISLSFDENLLFGYHDGIYVAGVDYMTQSGGQICSWGNYNRRGIESEMFGHLDYLENDSMRINQGIGFRIQGNCSRENAFKGTRIYARNQYDTKNSFDFSFFDQAIKGSVNPENAAFRRLTLRGPNYYDLAFSRLFQHVYEGINGRIKPCLKYFNGEFWGLTFLRDRFDTHHLANQFDVDRESIAIVKIGYAHEIFGGPINYANRTFFLSNGTEEDMDDFWDMRDFIIDNDMSDSTLYTQAEALVDISSYIDHLILKIYAGDSHYAPEYVFWRGSNAQSDGFGDGKWRVFVKDFDDACFSTANLVQAIAEGTHPRPYGYEMFASLLDSEDFRNRFINRFADLLNSHFLTHRFNAIIEDAFEQLSPYQEIINERWGDAAMSSPPRPFTNGRKNSLLVWSSQHPIRQRNHISDYFDLNQLLELTLDVSDTDHGYIQINTIDINESTPGLESSTYPWTGLYYAGVPVTITAKAKPGYTFVAWEGETEATNAYFTKSFEGESAWVKAIFAEDESYNASNEVIHYWHFNELNGNIESVAADISEAPIATISYSGDGDGYMDEVNEGTEMNAQEGVPSGKALRVRNPSAEKELIFHLPTDGYQAIKLSYASERTSNGQASREVHYRTQHEGPWIFLAEEALTTHFTVYEYDFMEVAGVNDNPHFALRFTFTGEEATNLNGNNRFDNILLKGTSIENWQRPLFAVQEGSYMLSEWSPDNFPGSSPNFMRFYWSDDPSNPEHDVTAAGIFPYDCGYNLSSRPRINGLGQLGFSFISTANPQFDFCGEGSAETERYTGSAEIGLNTEGVQDCQVSWTARLITEGARTYGLKLQYRTDTSSHYQELEASTIFSSSEKSEGDSAVYSIQLPEYLTGLPELYLRWVYYQIDGNQGNRPEIAIDDIKICACEALHSRQQSSARKLMVFPNPVIQELSVIPEGLEGNLDIAVTDLRGKVVLQANGHASDDSIRLNVSKLSAGLYLIRIESSQGIDVVKIVKRD